MRNGVKVTDPKSLVERSTVAKACAKELKFSMPLLIDEIDDGVAKAYGAYPDRLYLIGKDGKVVYRGAQGPRGFKPDELEKQLRSLTETE